MIILVLIILLLVIYRNYKKALQRKNKAAEIEQYKTGILKKEIAAAQKEKQKTQEAYLAINYLQSRKAELIDLLDLAAAKERRQLQKLEKDYKNRDAIGKKIIEKDLKEYERLKRQVLSIQNQIYAAEKNIIKYNAVIKGMY